MEDELITTPDVVEKEEKGCGGYDDKKMIPYSVTSFAQLDEVMAANEQAEEIGEMTGAMQQLVKNIMMSEEVIDKGAAIAALASEFSQRVNKPVEEESKEVLDADDIGFFKRLRNYLADVFTDDKAVWTSAYVSNLPDSSFLYVEGGGSKDEDGKTTPRNLRHLPYKDATGKVDLPHLRNAITRLSQSDTGRAGGERWLTSGVRSRLLGRARSILENENKGIAVWKEGGQYRWLAAYSNNYRDNDDPPEIISAASHKEFDEVLEKGEWPMPELWLWHVPYPVGQTLYHAYDESTGFAIAGGVFDEDKEWAAEGIIKANWDGVSHGMPVNEIERDGEDKTVIIRHRTREISPLPARAAANKLAFSIIKEGSDMADKGLPAHKRDAFVEAFGERVEEIEAELDKRAGAAKEAEIEQKDVQPQPEPVEEAQPVAELPLTRQEVLEALKPLAQAVAALTAEIKELKEGKQQPEEPKDLSALLLDALTATSVIGKKETRIDGRTAEAKDGPEEAPAQAAAQSWVERAFGNVIEANREVMTQ